MAGDKCLHFHQIQEVAALTGRDVFDRSSPDGRSGLGCVAPNPNDEQVMVALAGICHRCPPPAPPVPTGCLLSHSLAETRRESVAIGSDIWDCETKRLRGIGRRPGRARCPVVFPQTSTPASVRGRRLAWTEPRFAHT